MMRDEGITTASTFAQTNYPTIVSSAIELSAPSEMLHENEMRGSIIASPQIHL